MERDSDETTLATPFGEVDSGPPETLVRSTDANPHTIPREQILAHLEFERRIAQSSQLSLFRRNPSTWEILLLIALLDGDSDDGMYAIIEKVSTKYVGSSALLKFLRERRKDESLDLEDLFNRTNWGIRLAGPLLPGLGRSWRNLIIFETPEGACRAGCELLAITQAINTALLQNSVCRGFTWR